QCDAAFRGELGIFRGGHVTVNQCNWLGDDFGSDSALYLTNSLLVAVTNWGNMTYTTSATVYQATDPGGIFQTVGAGSHYLAHGSTNRNAGTTNIHADLLATLKTKTTYPPVVLSNVAVTVSTNLAPQAGRDTDVPDLGYHYEPLDFILAQFIVTNATLNLTNGVVMGYYNQEAGIWLREGRTIISTGTPLAPNRIVHYTLAQEQPILMGDADPAYSLGINSYHEGPPAPNGEYRFTRFMTPAGGSSLVHDTAWAYGTLVVQDCEIWGGWNYFSGNTGSVATVKNNLFHRAPVHAWSTSGSTTLSFFNNLVWGTAAGFLNSASPQLWRFEDNAFDHCSVTSYFTPLTNQHNAYINCNGRLQPASVNDIVMSSFSYGSGPLGDFYHGQADLVGKGSWTAASRGLYHHTTQTNQTKEGNSWLDIGFHYVAMTNGLPVDTDGDGLPDYLEDASGDGNYGFGDLSHWQVVDSDGDCIRDGDEYQQGSNLMDLPEFSTPPAYQILPIGATAVFSATLAQSCLSGYQWDRDYLYPIPGATNLTLTLTNVQLSNNGLYRLRAFSPTKSNSAAARLVVLDAPAWTIWTNYTAHTNGKTAEMWATYSHPIRTNPPALAWNTNSLLYGKTGFTAISQANSFQSNHAPVTALTRRHGFTAGHSLAPYSGYEGFAGHADTKVWFCTSDNQLVEATNVIAYARWTSAYDYGIPIFNDDLPTNITPIMVMTPPTSIGVCFRKCQHGLMSANLRPQTSLSEAFLPQDTSKPPFNDHNTSEGGDSGSPNMIPTTDGSLVFIGGISTSGALSVPMQEDMDYLCTNLTRVFRFELMTVRGVPDNG
ncbi:MAG: immunoglobulin domain-containing protein, partial [Verrucomicrobia bacterium]|nr:immunoglobulin domain-containing protein [Verrucomicrobiota bacterium]